MRTAVWLLTLACIPSIVHADLSFDGHNRFVMKGQRLAVALVNDDQDPALAEVSVDWGEEGRAESPPLAVSSPLVRISPKGRATVELLYQGQGLPSDRESYLLLNVLGVPRASDVPNTLQIALRHRFKLFYRPPLKETPDQARAMLSWALSDAGEGITARNASPYFVTVSDLESLGEDGQRCGALVDHLMIAPFSSRHLETQACRPATLRYQVVSDAGNLQAYAATLVSGAEQHGFAQH